jgi:Na+/melibiose symporter-like transporter
VAHFYNFIFHVFFGKMAAEFIGWADSPFQLEVGMASLGCSVAGFLAAFRSFDLRLAAIVSPAIFMLGAAAGHFHQMITARNFAPGNAGIMFWSDIVLPALGFLLLWLQRRASRLEKVSPSYASRTGRVARR